MNDMTYQLRYHADAVGGLDHWDVHAINQQLQQRTLHNRGDYTQPLDLVAERLLTGWPPRTS
jgi:hypothetical protein